MKALKEGSFAEVEQSKKLVCVAFTLPYAPRCEVLRKMLEELEDQDGRVDFFNADYYKCHSAFFHFGVYSFPAVLVLCEGREIARLSKFISREDVERVLTEILETRKTV